MKASAPIIVIAGAAGVWLDRCDLVAVDPFQAGDPVGFTAALQLVQPRKLGFVGGDDQLAAGMEGNPALLAVVAQLPRSLDAEPRLQRTRLVVDAGVHDAA